MPWRALPLALGFAVVAAARAGQPEPPTVPHFLGATACSSSGCHGGASEKLNQSLVWSTRDFHSFRPYATLTTARSKQIADAAKLGDATQATQCTVCHAPLENVPPFQRGAQFSAREAISCESCHGPAGDWLRSHTRPDLSHADRVHAGLRDLKNLYVRANTCVACHQTVGRELEKAGHPELIFELDGQSVTEPKHWRETAGWSRAQAWLVGQAAALREMTWQMQREPSDRLAARWRGLSWVVQKAVSPDDATTVFGKISVEFSAEHLRQVHSASDQLARDAAARKFSAEDTQQLLKRLAATHADFSDAAVPAPEHARRAERLVLALDRLVEATAAPAPVKAKLDELFKLAQSLPDFEPAKFSAALREFSAALP